MSNILPSSVIKATKGDYEVPIRRLWLETWRQLLYIPKAFWQAFGLVMLVLLGTIIFMGLLLQQYDLGLLRVQNHQVQLLSLHTLQAINKLKVLLSGFFLAIIEILRALLTVSLAFLGLHQIRNQTVKVTMVFAFLKNWRSLLFISVLFYFLSRIVHDGLFFLFKAIHLLSLQKLNQPIIVFAYNMLIFLSVLLNAYVMAVIFMAGLLIIDQKLTLKTSLGCAFTSVNRHALKNSALLFLASWAYIGAGNDLVNPLFSIRDGFGLYFYYLVLLPGLILAASFIIYKIIMFKNKPSRIKNITLIAIKFILGVLILVSFFLGGGLIWLLPVVSLLLAIQYQYIFLDNHLAYV